MIAHFVLFKKQASERVNLQLQQQTGRMKISLAFILTFFTILANAQKNVFVLPPALSSIKEEDLKQDLFVLASGNMRGRRAGTPDELRAAAWIAEQARKAGLKPAGDDGTYFQYFPIRRITVSEGSTLALNGKSVALWKDAWLTRPVESRLEGSVTWLKTLADTSTGIKGKMVAMNLLGSQWYVRHPTVKKESIAAVLNGDMIGRNNPDSAALLGAVAPHRNSAELVAIAMKSNSQLTHFKIDTSWDAADHPENWYFRSDHLSYAQAGIPAIFFTTLLHPDYHTPRDEAQRIDIKKLSGMTKWMYATGWSVGNNKTAPAIDTN
ncbi:MAG: M28 family peptidase [Segetibacter sp.]